MNRHLSEVPLTIRPQMVYRRLGTKQVLLGATMFFILTGLLSVNLKPHSYLLQPVGLSHIAGASLFVFGVLILSALYLYQFRPYTFSKSSLLLLLGLITVLTAGFAKVIGTIAATQGSVFGFLIPIAFSAMLVTVLYDSYLAIMIVVSTSIFAGLVTGDNFAFTAAGLLGGAIAIYAASGLTDRSELTRTGFVTGAGLAFFCGTIGLMERSPIVAALYALAGLTNGVFSAVLALGSLPFLERQFGLVTPMRLLALASPNQPLLRMLMAKAPGTYNHSIGVGNLGEAAAEAIGADSLLVRVGAYYHDIGKVKRPGFFVENQVPSGNRHEKINPKLSCLVITSHVKEGVETAKQYDLPQPIVDLIAEHHGTGLVSFFYHQARKNSQLKEVREEQYRYPGGKPHSREAAILMLADAAEAAAKAVTKPSMSKFEELVKSLVRDRLDDGQLDESDLTLADLNKIIKSFTQGLIGIYHPRVEYPEDRADRTRMRNKRVFGGHL